MKCIRIIFLLLSCLITASQGFAQAELDGPLYRMLWNKMKAVRVIDDHFAVGISDDAVIVAELVDSLRAFEVIRVAPVDFLPTDLKEFDTLLIVRAEDNRLSAYRIASLPDLECLWTVDPGIVFADFTFHEKSLYFSSWYDGLWRFTLDADNRAQFVDSSMVGILMTDLAIDNDTLYALDEYNGIARYALDGYDFGQFLDYLYVSFEASGFVRLDSIFLITQKTGGVVTGSFGRQGLGIIDTLADVGNPRQIYLTADELVFVEDRFVRVLNRSTLEVTNITEIKIGGFTGDMFIWKGREHLILPRDERGLIAFDLLNPYLPRSMLYRSGPVEDILVVDGRLITGGGANPIDVFSFDVDLTPQLNYTMYEDLTNVQALQNNGDTLIAYLADSNKIVFIVQSLDPDSFFIERSFYLDDTLAGELLWLDHKLDSVNVIMTVGRSRIQTYTISDSTIITAMEPWHFEGRITSILVHSNILFVATSRNQLSTHLITPDFELEQLSIENLTGPAYEMIWTDNRLLVPVYYDLAIYDMTDPRKPEVDTVINLPLTVLASDRTEETLCMVGPEGIGVMDMTGDYPELIAFGGEGGTMIDVDGDLLVASDGGSINIYNIAHTDQPNEPPILPTSFVTEQNYPNPFNTGTTIQYCLFTRSHVEIDVFNVLGQRVRTLVNADQSANSYEITWDGTNNRHQSVASGVYFYRVRAGDFVATRKMLLLK